MKKERKDEGTEQWYDAVREFCKGVRAQGKVGKEIAQNALSVAGLYWVMHQCGSKTQHTRSFLLKIRHILRRSGLDINRLC